jgi:hypothetical protein
MMAHPAMRVEIWCMRQHPDLVHDRDRIAFAPKAVVAGGVISAAARAAIAASMEPRRRGYYWYRGRRWLRRGNGSDFRVVRRYC